MENNDAQNYLNGEAFNNAALLKNVKFILTSYRLLVT